MILSSRFIKQFHPIFDVRFNLNLLLFQLFLQQLRTVLNKSIFVEKISFTSMSHINYLQTTFDLSSVITTFSKTSCASYVLTIPSESWFIAVIIIQFVSFLPIIKFIWLFLGTKRLFLELNSWLSQVLISKLSKELHF